MRIYRASALVAGAVVAALAVGIPALGQDKGQKPESILPPGFNDPVTAPTPAPTATSAAPGPARPAQAPGTAAPLPMVEPLPSEPGLPTPAPTPSATPTMDAATVAKYEMPLYARRSLAFIGPATRADGALDATAFGKADGQFLETLMRRLDTPIASRWIEIGLRRALVTRVLTPVHVNGADFAAERAWLLLRMGESVAARDVVQSVDTINATPKLYQMVMQASLATGDPAGLCPFADKGYDVTGERGWVLAQPICAGLSGMPGKVSPLFKAARAQGLASGIDVLLAQKVAGSGASGRQAVTIEWDDVDTMSAWRYGLAMATNSEIPETLLATLAPHVQSWRAQAPGLAPVVRAGVADYAAARGVLSSTALIDLYGSISEIDDSQSSAEAGVARDLRAAYEAGDVQTRLASLQKLWDEPKAADGKFARLILTSHAAARIPVGADKADADRLVAAMLTAGLEMPALRWRGKVSKGGDAWAMLMLADPAHAIYPYADIDTYSGADRDGLKRRMLFAGMAGLGRMTSAEIEKGARALDLSIGAQNSWTRAIGQAALNHEPGTVLVLAGVGMQTKLWHGVSPETVFHVVTALRAAGMEGLARMVAVEAITRL